MRDALSTTERQLAQERQQLADAERRGGLAAQLPDPDTVRIAGQFAERHRERSAVLAKKLALQQEELALAERDFAQLSAEYRGARQGTEGSRTPAQEAAWRDLESAGGTRPETELEGELLQSTIERQQMDAAVAAQLEHLKKKMRQE
jgi:hypothetical protein